MSCYTTRNAVTKYGGDFKVKQLLSNPNPGNPDTGNPDSSNPDSGNPDSGNPDSGNPDSFEPTASFSFIPVILSFYRSPGENQRQSAFQY